MTRPNAAPEVGPFPNKRDLHHLALEGFLFLPRLWASIFNALPAWSTVTPGEIYRGRPTHPVRTASEPRRPTRAEDLDFGRDQPVATRRHFTGK